VRKKATFFAALTPQYKNVSILAACLLARSYFLDGYFRLFARSYFLDDYLA
jgi:hypothetical protein